MNTVRYTGVAGTIKADASAGVAGVDAIAFIDALGEALEAMEEK